MSLENKSKQSRKQRKKSQQKKGKQQKRRFFPTFLWISSVIAVILVISSAIFVFTVVKGASTLSASDLESPLSTRVYDQDQELIGTLFKEENRIKVSIDDIPEQMRDAIISIEDKQFYKHHGIDPLRVLGAAKANVKHGWGTEGGSTLSQQLIKRTILTPDKTLKRKIKEAWLALKLERKYSKDEILEMYLNNVYFGHGAYGIQMASVNYFNEEDLSKLNLSQIALLAGLPNAPSAGNPFESPEQAKQRMTQVLDAMVTNDVISEKEAQEASVQDLTDILDEGVKKDDIPYSAYMDAVYDELVKKKEIVSEQDFYQGGLEIYTHLDKDTQQMINDLLHSEDIPYPDEHFETGISLVDTQTGVIKAIGGGRNFTSIQDMNYGASVQNQPGSTIKPILDYGPAIEHLKWSTAHPITDEPYQYSDGTPVSNWDNQHWGGMTVRRALEWSRNIPALKAFQEVGSDQAQAFASGLGIEIEPIYEAAALGGFNGVSPLELASANAAFGNGGTYHEPSTVKSIAFPDGEEWEPKQTAHQAMQDYTAYIITDMLKSVITTGTGADANIPGVPVAGKTGSTNIPKDIRQQYGINEGLLDSWFTGYTTEYSLAIWSGYPSLKSKNNDIQYIRSDGSQHIPKMLFKEIMTELSDEQTADFKQPDSVVLRGSELYVQGTEQSEHKEPKPEQPNKMEQEKEDLEEDEEEQEDKEEDKEEEEEEKEEKKEEKQEQESDDKKEKENTDKEMEDKENSKEENDKGTEEEKEKEMNDEEQDKKNNKDKNQQNKKGKDTEKKQENDSLDSS